jgi:YjbE family integral membrane protein
MDLAVPAFWLPILQIVWIDILLSGDNALVIALACRSLPAEQRRLGILLGSCAAIALRIAFTLLLAELLGLPFVKIAGGIVLLWIAVRLSGPELYKKNIPPAESLWSAIKIIAMADTVMSLDNMLAVVAVAKGSKLLIFLGLALTIPFLISGSAMVLALLNRLPILVWAGGVFLGWVAGNLIGSDAALHAFFGAPLAGWGGAAGAALVAAAALLRRWHRRAAKEV